MPISFGRAEADHSLPGLVGIEGSTHTSLSCPGDTVVDYELSFDRLHLPTIHHRPE